MGMKKEIVGLIVAIILLFNFGQFKAEASPETNALIKITLRMADQMEEVSNAALTYQVHKIPKLIHSLDADLIRFDRAYEDLGITERYLLEVQYLDTRSKIAKALEEGHKLMRILGQK